MKKSSLLIAMSVVSLGVSANAAAVDHGQWYFAPNLSYVIADDDRFADDDFGLQLGVGQVINESWNVEFSAVMDTLDQDNSGAEFKQRGLQFDGLYFFDRDRRFDPYLVGGVGGLQTKFAGDKSTNMIANVGAGLMHMINDSTSLRADARYRLDVDETSIATENRFGDWVLNIGLAIPFGGSKAVPVVAPVVAAAVMSEPVVMDSDADGVPDSKDRCANTVSGGKVDVNGCEIDTDKDGVVDRLDRCAVTAAGAKVDTNGCELDADKDGIVDRLDACPATAAGAKVDGRGCEIADVIVLNGVTFNTGSVDLTVGSKAVLNDVAMTLKKNSNLVVEVGGYTDNTGARTLNISLSQRRAQSVVDYLLAQGVNADKLTAKGFGPANPIADNSTVDGRAANRRVELHIVK